MFSLHKSPNDLRDLKFTKTTTELPESFDLREKLMPVRDQGPQGTCAAQVASCMKEYQERMERGFNEYMSPQFIYNNRSYWNNEIQDGEDINEDYGMTCRDIMKILSKIGVCPERMYPYGLIQYAKEIGGEIKKEAVKNCIKGYAQIFTIDDTKHSLLENGPCMIAFPIYTTNEDMWNPPFSDCPSLGGHAMTIVGYNKNGFIIRNTWGDKWGDNGHCIYPYDDWGAHWEIWTTVDKKNPTPENKPLPPIIPPDIFPPPTIIRICPNCTIV